MKNTEKLKPVDEDPKPIVIVKPKPKYNGQENNKYNYTTIRFWNGCLSYST